jgi:hypothetical protein
MDQGYGLSPFLRQIGATPVLLLDLSSGSIVILGSSSPIIKATIDFSIVSSQHCDEFRQSPIVSDPAEAALGFASPGARARVPD